MCWHGVIRSVSQDGLETAQVQRQWAYLAFLSQCLKPVLQEKEPGIAGKMADSKAVVGEIEDERMAHCIGRKVRETGPCWRDTGTKQKTLLAAKSGIIWTMI